MIRRFEVEVIPDEGTPPPTPGLVLEALRQYIDAERISVEPLDFPQWASNAGSVEIQG